MKAKRFLALTLLALNLQGSAALASELPSAALPGEQRPFLLGGIQTHEKDHQRWMAALHRAGMNTVQATVYAHHGPWNTSKLWYSKDEPSVLAEIRAARRNGIQVILILRVALEHSDPENRHLWHGMVYPETERQTQAWFRTYTDFVVRWARIAEREGVEVLAIASEMNALTATAPIEEIPELALWYLDDLSQQRLRALVGRSKDLFTERIRLGMGAGEFSSVDDFLVQRNLAERTWAQVYTFAGLEDQLAAMNERRLFLDQQWRRLIRKVRRAYSGRLTLAANFDNYHEVSFWDALDLIGINAYFPLRETLETPLSEEGLVEAWREVFAGIEAFAEDRNLPQQVVFTELGYTRWSGVTMAPWSSQGFIPMWDPDGDEAQDRAFFWEHQPLDAGERAMALRALHRVWREGETRLAGVLYWKLSSKLELQRFEPFMLYLGEGGDDPGLPALQRFVPSIRPLGPSHPDENAYFRAADAILRGDLETLSSFKPPVRRRRGRQPLLHLAVRRGQEDMVRYLLEAGARLRQRDPGGYLPLHWACYQKNIELVDLLLPPEGISRKDKLGETPLMKCARLDNTAVARRLLALGGEVEAREDSKQAALLLAVGQASPEMVRTLLAGGAQRDAPGELGKTPLHVAAARGDIDIVKVLAQGSRGVADLEGNWPISEAAIHGHAAVFHLLFEPEQARRVNRFGQSLLHLAAHGGSPEILETLLEYFPDIDLQDVDGWTPMAFGTRNVRSEAVEIFLARGASIERPNNSGITSLHLAAAIHDPRLLQLFLEYEVDLDRVDQWGNTALHYAAGWGRIEPIRLLTEAGADQQHRNSSGGTPLDLAWHVGNRRAALWLQSAPGAPAEVKPITSPIPEIRF